MDELLIDKVLLGNGGFVIEINILGCLKLIFGTVADLTIMYHSLFVHD